LWPSRSPDLSPPDLCLWGFFKENIYRNNPDTKEEFEQNIELCISNFTAEILHWLASSMRRRTLFLHEIYEGHSEMVGTRLEYILRDDDSHIITLQPTPHTPH
jgi:hypothetical protein